MIVDVQFNPARWTWPEIRERAVRAEAEGYGAVWVFDHLSGRVLRGERMLECFTLAGALAAATDTIGVGALVVNAANRPPAVTAIAAASVQEISGGRFTFGLGAGTGPGTRWAREHEVAAIPLSPTMYERHEHVAAVLDVCESMWSPDRPERWAGFPLPDPAPPVVVGVNSVHLAELAGQRADGLNIRADHPRLAPIIGAARQARMLSLRAATPLSVSVWAFASNEAVQDPDSELRAHLEALGVERLVLVR